MSATNESPQEEILQQIKNCIVYYRQISRKDQFQYKLHNRITALMDNYVALADGEENKQLSAGRLLWKTKDYFYSGFKHNTGKLIDHIVNSYDLSDKDKINFTNLAVTTHMTRYIDEKAFNKLSNIHPVNDYVTKQSRQVLSKVMGSLNRESKDLKQYVEKARRLVGFMNFYGSNVQSPDREMIKQFADTMFTVSNRLNDYNQTVASNQKLAISLVPLAMMLTKTKGLKEKHAHMKSLFTEEYPDKAKKPIFDVVATQEVLKLYRKRVLNYSAFNKYDNNLDLSMEKMMKHFVTKYEIKPAEVNSMVSHLSDKYSNNLLQRRLNILGAEISKAYKKSQPTVPSVSRRKVSPHAVGAHYYREKLGRAD